MNSTQFQNEAIRTDLENYGPVQQRLKENAKSLKSTINGFLLSSSAMDLLKKKVMYNSDPLKLIALDAELSKNLQEFPLDFVEKVSENENLSQLFHYTIGAITETNEILLGIGNAVKTGELDVVNMGEEIGDIFFYLSVMATRLGLSLEDIMETNNKKLRARYPSKFTENDANNRDLLVEREILEGNV
jgi:NTP pyrophosphatase (non-canonical NTP hydrolase)